MTNYTHHLDEWSSAAPAYSPGIVKSDEFLLRRLFNPQHVVGGKLLPAAIPAKDLHTEGFSVHRLKYVSKEFIEATIKDTLSKRRKGNTTWTSEGVAKLSVSGVRQIKIAKEQIFVVVDSAKENDYGHADILVATPEKGISHAREMRKLLLPLMEKRMPVEQAFEGVQNN